MPFGHAGRVPAAPNSTPWSISNKDVEMRSPLFALSLSLSVATLLAAKVSAADLAATSVWKTDFAAAQAEAKKLNRPIVVHFHATWCGPCKRMEREVLDTQQVLKLLDAGFVAVKVDVDRNGEVSKKYGVGVMPTDLILDSAGKVLVKTEGYQPESGDRQKYIKNVTRIDARYAAERAKIARTDSSSAGKTSSGAVAAEKAPVVASENPLPKVPPRVNEKGDKLVPPPSEPKKLADATGPASPAAPRIEKTEDPPTVDAAGLLLALDGYCPVTLRATRAWKSGSSDIALDHDGQTFYFAGAEKRDEFKAHPERYAPRLLGCDPVVLAENDLAVRGSVKFGAFYEGELFLFETADSRVKFRKDPSRYARLQHVVKPEDVKKIASTSGD
jgi:thiol-disulfide isomerase/thioredoxin/YHS domain-containing protein